MTIFLVLDILLILLVLLFMPIGFWRGPIKELFVTLGIMTGVLLADFWARPWGRDLTEYTELTAGSGAFIIAMAFLVAATFVLGYGLGATLAPTYHSNLARALGAGIAAVNGTLLLSFALQYVRLHLLSTANADSLDDSYMARFLLDGIGWVLLGAAFIAIPLLLFVLVSGRRAYEPEYEEYEYVEEYEEPQPAPRTSYRRARVADAQTNVLPPRVPASPREDDERNYKAEPEPRRQRASAETRPLIVTEPEATSEPPQQRSATTEAEPQRIVEPEPAPAVEESSTHVEPAQRDSGNVRIGDTDPHIVLPAEMRGGTPPQPAAPAPEPERESNLAPGYTRCTTCHAVLSPDISICPNCGTLR